MPANKAGEEDLVVVVVVAEGAEGEGGAVVEVMVVVAEDEDVGVGVVVGRGQPACEASRPWIDSWRSMPVDQETQPRYALTTHECKQRSLVLE